jgi:hypothetical protein
MFWIDIGFDIKIGKNSISVSTANINVLESIVFDQYLDNNVHDVFWLLNFD